MAGPRLHPGEGRAAQPADRVVDVLVEAAVGAQEGIVDRHAEHLAEHQVRAAERADLDQLAFEAGAAARGVRGGDPQAGLPGEPDLRGLVDVGGGRPRRAGAPATSSSWPATAIVMANWLVSSMLARVSVRPVTENTTVGGSITSGAK
ncbi:hypothetical protein [Amycolatopsis solani]|uniref:hypothetical protein n=1 Tax=Amycolatopsis solani TaxID=3028615 RepID=UPI0025AFEDAB|nr:hypothetical protein [Amycolatopsis sp. MEP2-6]